MLIKEDVLDVIQNIITQPVNRDSQLPKEIQILKAIEEMPDWTGGTAGSIILCNNCTSYHPDDDATGVCDLHHGTFYYDDYCSYGVKK